MKSPHVRTLTVSVILFILFNCRAEEEETNNPYIKFNNHRFNFESASNNNKTNKNITILHEINDDRPIELNTHEVLPMKPLKKKTFNHLHKTTTTTSSTASSTTATTIQSGNNKNERIRPAITFDFNLGDLEDIPHGTVKKGDLSILERHLLRNDNDEGLTYTEFPLLLTPSNDDESEIQTIPSSQQGNIAKTSESIFPDSSPNIFKVIKNKSKSKGRELLLKEELQKTFGNHYNSINHFLTGETHENASSLLSSSSAESLHSDDNDNIFQIIINLFDHFYWQPSDIRAKVSPVCGVEIHAYLTALNNNYEWAQKAYDASGRYRGQILFGSDKWIGQKTFCFEVNRKNTPTERKHFEFAFYAALVRLTTRIPSNLTTTIELGECLPKSCTPHDIETILNLDPHARVLAALNSPTANGTQFKILKVRSVPGKYCWWKDIKFQIFTVIILIFFFTVVIATWYQAKLNKIKDVKMNQMSLSNVKVDPKIGLNPESCSNDKGFEIYQMKTMNGDNNNIDIESDMNGNRRSKDGKQLEKEKTTSEQLAEKSSSSTKLSLHEEVLLCFAFQKNASKIMSMTENKENQISCIHGLRVFSVLWTIMVHTYLQMFTIGENRFYRIVTERSIFYQFIGNATFSVDTFFFISGLLVVLLYLKQEKKNPDDRSTFIKRSIVDSGVIIFYRYIRLTPAYLFVIFFNDLSLRHVFDNSVFQQTVAATNCTKYWWRNILYINNFFRMDEICMIWSWYMANDMQFYILASALLAASTRYFKASVLLLITLLFASWGITGIISLQHNYTHKVADPFESFDFLYDKPWQRIGTYIMGMLTGYIIHNTKTPPKISNRMNLFLWTGSITLLISIIFCVWDGELSIMATAFYVSIGHTAFGFALIWIVLSCCWGLAGPVNKVLSYRGLWPLSRLTYCTYLIHPVIMLITAFRMEGTVHLNNLLVMSIFLGNAVISFSAAFIISVIFEAPVIRLLKICFRK